MTGETGLVIERREGGKREEEKIEEEIVKGAVMKTERRKINRKVRNSNLCINLQVTRSTRGRFVHPCF